MLPTQTGSSHSIDRVPDINSMNFADDVYFTGCRYIHWECVAKVYWGVCPMQPLHVNRHAMT